MNVLAIDTSGPVCGVAVMTAEGIRFACAVQNKRTHSVNLMPMIDAGLRATGLTLQDMDRLACTVGPGSFTGVRLGVSTLKGLAHGCGKPCAGVNALEALAAGAGAFPGVVCPIQDARAGQVYGAAFRCTAEGAAPVRLMPDAPLKLEDYVQALLPLAGEGEAFLFLGDGMPVHRARLQELLGTRAVFAAPARAFLNPAAVAQLAALAEETVDYLALQPLYLRAPNAQRNRKLVEAAHAQ